MPFIRKGSLWWETVIENLSGNCSAFQGDSSRGDMKEPDPGYILKIDFLIYCLLREWEGGREENRGSGERRFKKHF